MDTLNTAPGQTVEVFDIMAFEDLPSAEVRIKHPLSGAPTPILIMLAGPEHPQRKAREMARQRKMRAQLQRTGKVQLGDPEEDLIDETQELADCTLGWMGLATPYSRAAAAQLYADPKRQWLRAQVRTALAERENFIASSVPA